LTQENFWGTKVRSKFLRVHYLMEDRFREHLFISYASEDEALAEWLALKLTAEGYRVWCDRFKLLGGESYPKDIDFAIKNQTFRLIALLSKNSISKPNPLKERTLAMNISRERKIDFLIPLNVDGLKPTELDWMTSDLTFISFYNSWAEGLKSLLGKMQSIKTPQPLKDGRIIAAETFFPSEIITNNEEVIYSNILHFSQLPEAIKRYELNRNLENNEVDNILKIWPFYPVDRRTVLAFHLPNEPLPDKLTVRYKGGTVWQLTKEIDGIKTKDVGSSLLKKSLIYKALNKGLVWTQDRKHLYFPKGLLHNNRINLTSYRGNKISILVSGERKNRQIGIKEYKKYRYHLSPTFRIIRNLKEEFMVRLGVRLYFVWDNGDQMAPRSAFSRRKVICKYWYNHEWLIRLLAICQFMSDGRENIIIGDSPREQIIISSKLLKFTAPFGLDEAKLSKQRIEISDIHGNMDYEDISYASLEESGEYET